MDTKAYIKMAKGSPIQGYYDYDNDSDSQNNRKMDWLKTGKRILKQLAKELGLPEGSYDLRVNAGGVAVSGDVHLHSECFYVKLSQSCLGPEWGYMWRLCAGRKDYTGGTNQWMGWDNLLDLPKVAGIMKGVHERSCRNEGI